MIKSMWNDYNDWRKAEHKILYTQITIIQSDDAKIEAELECRIKLTYKYERKTIRQPT